MTEGKRKTVVVANPTAGGGKVRRGWGQIDCLIARFFGVAQPYFTEAAGHGIELTREAIRQGCSRIVAVGGDGTINEVVNGILLEGAGNRVELGVYPVGTGGDLSRSLGLANGGEDLSAFERMSPRRIDVGRVTLADGSVRYFLNVASFGSSAEIVDRANASSKKLGGRLSFALATVKGLTAYRNQPVRIRVDDRWEEDATVNVVAIANGRYFGGGMMIAPSAELDDGALEVTMVGDASVFDFLRQSRKIYRGELSSIAEVRQSRGATIRASAVGQRPVRIEADGEPVGALPAAFDCIPGALTVLAPWRTP